MKPKEEATAEAGSSGRALGYEAVDPELRRKDRKRNLAALRKATRDFAWAVGAMNDKLAMHYAYEIEQRAVNLRLIIDGSYYEDDYEDRRKDS